jgi:hypothetical protein
MRFIPSKLHGIVDHLVGLVLLAAPTLLGYAAAGGAAVWVPRVLGVVIMAQAAFTDFEAGLVRVLPFRVHLLMDFVLGAFLALAPFLLEFYDGPNAGWLLPVLAGLLLLGQALFTQPRVERRQSTPAR